jgi:hypothetical protein
MRNRPDSKRTKSTRAKVRDLTPRNTKDAKGGRSDLGQKLQIQLTEANNIYTRR